jgi:uncharacterized protein involved in outer membrane biogenesis
MADLFCIRLMHDALQFNNRNKMEKENTTANTHIGRKIAWGFVILVIAGLIVFRIYLPGIVLKYVNKKLDNIPEYKGHVNDITMSLWRGAYQIQGVELNKLNGKVPVPFFSAETVDLSIEWKALLHGAFVGKIRFIQPKVNFVKGPTEAESQSKVDKSWVQTVRQLFPLTINRFDIDNGEVHFRDFHSDPKVDIYLSHIEASATNLSNKADKDKLMPSDVDISATCFESGHMNIQMAIDPLNENPTFELKERLEHVDLTRLNDFLFAYGKVKVKKGTLGLYSEIAAKDGAFEGYSKPLLKDVEIDLSLEDKTLLQQLWADVATGVTWVLTNPPKDQVATKIPIQGKFNQPNLDIWATIGNLVKNAFFEALSPSFENSVHISNVPEAEAAIKAGKESQKGGKEEKKGVLEKWKEKRQEKRLERKEKREERKKEKDVPA